MAKEGFFLGLGPWPNAFIGMGSLVCYPHNYFYYYLYCLLYDLVNVIVIKYNYLVDHIIKIN